MPNTTLYKDSPVALEDYIEEYEQIISSLSITHISIFDYAESPSKVYDDRINTKISFFIFQKNRGVIEEIDYMLYTVQSAFDSHSNATAKRYIDIFGSFAYKSCF